jgi:DNA-binding transcriptional MerR regulator
MAEPEYDLKTLCDRAKVTPRTVHFYAQHGLLPPAGAPGPGARYGRGHELRLTLIRLLQKQHLPLAEISRRMKRLTDAQVGELIADTRERTSNEGGGALEYIRGLLAEKAESPAREPGPRSAPAARLWRTSRSSNALAAVPEPARRFHVSASSALSRSQWERFALADGIELHVQRPLTRLQQKKLDRLLVAARDLFQED